MFKNIKKIIMLLMIISLISIPNIAKAQVEDFINIKIGSYSVNTEIKSENGFIVYDEDKTLALETISSTELKIKEIRNQDLLILVDEFNNEYELMDKQYLGSNRNQYIQVAKNKYRGYITFRNGSIINNLDVNEYLYGVVPREIPASSNLEALKAQAIVARTFAYANIGKHKSEGYDLCMTTHCQVYGTVSAEKESTTNAVNLTRGEYITYNGTVANTPYNASSGGYVESSKNVWGGETPYLQAKLDPYSSKDQYSSWELVLKPQEIESKLSKAGINIGNLLQINIKSTTTSGRVDELELVGSLKTEVITGNKFRTIIGNTTLKSTLFTITNSTTNQILNNIYVVDYKGNKKDVKISDNIAIDNIGNKKIISGKERMMSKDKLTYMNVESSTLAKDGVVFKGSGYGHGVGMSQYGAIEMAKQGFSCEDIIKHYYTDVEIKKK